MKTTIFRFKYTFYLIFDSPTEPEPFFVCAKHTKHNGSKILNTQPCIFFCRAPYSRKDNKKLSLQHKRRDVLRVLFTIYLAFYDRNFLRVKARLYQISLSHCIERKGMRNDNAARRSNILAINKLNTR